MKRLIYDAATMPVFDTRTWQQKLQDAEARYQNNILSAYQLACQYDEYEDVIPTVTARDRKDRAAKDRGNPNIWKRIVQSQVRKHGKLQHYDRHALDQQVAQRLENEHEAKAWAFRLA
jgi:hypothetical protein